MPRFLAAFATLSLSALTLACGSVNTSRLPHGGFRISCEKGMEDCVSRADKLCSGKGYTILGGQNETEQLGGASSNYQTVKFVGELEIVCGKVEVAAPACKPISTEETVHRVGEPAPVAPVLPAPPTTTRACVPGSTQTCVGAAACAGGQVCLADGSGYGACDCGTTTSSSAVAPVLPPTAAPSPPSQKPTVPGAAPPAEPLNVRK